MVNFLWNFWEPPAPIQCFVLADPHSPSFPTSCKPSGPWFPATHRVALFSSPNPVFPDKVCLYWEMFELSPCIERAKIVTPKQEFWEQEVPECKCSDAWHRNHKHTGSRDAQKTCIRCTFFFKIFLFLHSFIYGCVGTSFLCEGFLQLRQAGATLHRGARASHHRGLSRCGAQAPDAQAQQLWLTGPVAPRHVGSSQTRARTRVPCIGRRTLNHCATREAPWISHF